MSANNPVTCQDLSTFFVDYVDGNLPEAEAAEVRHHLGQCAACQAEVESLGAVWQTLGELAEEEPSEELRQRFYSTLDAYQDGMGHSKSWGDRFSEWLASWWPTQPAMQAAWTAAALVLGLLAGARFFAGGGNQELAEMRAEMASLNRLVSLSLLNQQSASSRLQGVSYSRRSADDEEVVDALVDVLNGDDNVAVRLAAVDALAGFAERPRLADELRSSLLAQSSPLVQVALVEVLAELGGAETVRTLDELAQRRGLDEAVRSRIARHLGPNV